MKTKRTKFSLKNLKPVGPLQTPRDTSLDNIHMAMAMVFPEATEGHRVIPLGFSRKELEAVTNFVASEQTLPLQMKPLLPMARALLRGWLNSKSA